MMGEGQKKKIEKIEVNKDGRVFTPENGMSYFYDGANSAQNLVIEHLANKINEIIKKLNEEAE
jgi:hypothetical protein